MQKKVLHSQIFGLLICATLFACSGKSGSDGEYQDGDGGNNEQVDKCSTVQPPPDVKVNLPADEAAHFEDLEWWYWTGHLKTASGRWFGFEQVFFLAKQYGIYGQVVHHAISDIDAGTFHYIEHIKAARPASKQDGYIFDVNGLTAEGGGEGDAIHGAVDNYVLDINTVPLRPEVYQHGDGYTDYPFGGNTYYYSREKMVVTGTLSIDGTPQVVTGSAWFDHQWGKTLFAVNLGWDWFALQLDDNTQIMLFIVRNNGSDVLVGGSLTGPDCQTEEISSADYQVTALGEWTSTASGCTYPAGWTVTVRGKTYTVTPAIDDQELRTSIVNYWEGAATVSGDAKGRAYVELTGYCQ